MLQSTYKKMKAFINAFIIIACVSSCSSNEAKKEGSENTLKAQAKKPNIIVILTDQERYPTHWPDGWAEKNLPSYARLKKHGLTFHRAYTAACECAPSRAVLFSGEHYPINKVNRTPPTAGLPSAKELVDIGSLLKKHTEYEVVWKGKWHLSPPLKGGHAWTRKDIIHMQKNYNIYGWNPPDAGTALSEKITNPDGSLFDGLTTLGGGFANNDTRFVQGMQTNAPKQTPGWGESVLEYLHKVGTRNDKSKPFCLFVSLVNPHDVWVYPEHWKAAGYKKEDFIHMGIKLPSNFDDDLSTKPSVQAKVRDAFNKHSPLANTSEQTEYVNFYAYLHTVVDSHIQSILDALDKYGLTDDTIIIRTADHGELGLSHGMREKSYTAYEEMIHIPLVVSNPKMYPQPQETHAFYCHLDLLPTLAELTGVPHFSQYGKGVSVVPVLNDPSKEVQDSILFTFDDVFFLPENTPGGHIRAIRDGKWTYAAYFSEDGSHFEYELYNLDSDPGQLNNLLAKSITPENAQEARRLHQKLKDKIENAKALPEGVMWPNSPL